MENSDIYKRLEEEYGIDLNSTETQKMAEPKATHDILQETLFGWLKGTTFFIISEFSSLTYKDFAEHIGCDAQEYRYKALGEQRVFIWTAAENPIVQFGAFFRENDDGEWTIWATGSAQIKISDEYIDYLKNR